MKKIIGLVFPLLLLCLLGNAQHKYTVSGTLVDRLDVPLSGATVVLLQEVDSVLLSFSISNGAGLFSIPRVETGKYLLQITYLGYANYEQNVEVLANGGDLDLGEIVLAPEDALLDEVLIKAEHIPIVFKNDTIEYNAAAFKTRPNAAVEELLKKLPGVEVERDGTVRAQGEVVRNVLVDGKQFFGDDPQIATQNLPADAVDKVQVFDKKSDMAEFSGIDDGQEQKTINLSLKEDKKAGYFGKISGGYGSDHRYENKANVNRFSGKMQLSALGMLNNTNKQGFSINDYMNFMGGLRNMMSGGGGSMTLSFDSNETGLPIDMGGNNGLVNTAATGLNFNYDFSKKTKWRSSYFFNRIKTVAERSLSRQNLVAENSFDFLEEGTQINRNKNHRINLRLEHDIDAFSDLILRSNLGANDSELANDQFSKTFNTQQLLQNDSERDYQSNANRFDLRSNLTYRRRFRKKGRVVVADLSLAVLKNNGNADLAATNRFYDPELTTIVMADTLQQDQLQENNQMEYGASLSYTEPLGKGRYVGFTYKREQFNNKVEKGFYDTQFGERNFNADLSNRYKRNYRYDRGGINFRLNRKKWNFNTGLNVQHSMLNGDFQGGIDPIRKRFVNFLPSLFLTVDLATARSIELNYRTSVREPALEQLQPIVDNSDPLRLYTGNPDLRPEYAHDLNLSFMSFDQFSFTNIFANLLLRYTQNRITNARTIDALFRQNIQPVNVKDDILLNSTVSFGTPIRAFKIRMNIDLENRYNRARLLVNEIEEISHLWTSTLDFTIGNRNKDNVDILLGTRLTYNQNRYSVSEKLNQSYLNQTHYLDFNIKLGKTWELGTSLDYTIYSAENFGDRRVVPIWKAALSKTLFNNRLELKLSAFDLLNKNIGLSRNSAWNYIEEERIRSIGRYVMVSMVYSLSGFGGGSSGIEIKTSRRN